MMLSKLASVSHGSEASQGASCGDRVSLWAVLNTRRPWDARRDGQHAAECTRVGDGDHRDEAAVRPKPSSRRFPINLLLLALIR